MLFLVFDILNNDYLCNTINTVWFSTFGFIIVTKKINIMNNNNSNNTNQVKYSSAFSM